MLEAAPRHCRSATARLPLPLPPPSATLCTTLALRAAALVFSVCAATSDPTPVPLPSVFASPCSSPASAPPRRAACAPLKFHFFTKEEAGKFLHQTSASLPDPSLCRGGLRPGREPPMPSSLSLSPAPLLSRGAGEVGVARAPPPAAPRTPLTPHSLLLFSPLHATRHSPMRETQKGERWDGRRMRCVRRTK